MEVILNFFKSGKNTKKILDDFYSKLTSLLPDETENYLKVLEKNKKISILFSNRSIQTNPKIKQSIIECINSSFEQKKISDFDRVFFETQKIENYNYFCIFATNSDLYKFLITKNFFNN